MGNIVLLDDLTINKIAAGEVIERPASVVKELVENSIDAGSDKIDIEIKNGGISYIRITDNGKGIAPDDMEIAFERHATSKIRTADDLLQVTSMGFRGEALASIAAISKIEMVSRQEGEETGYRVVVEAGNILEKEEYGCPVGTTITITNLFFNTPVRYKFLKKDYTESGYIEDFVTRLAIINTSIAIKLVNSGKTVIQTSGDNNLKNVIYSIYGKDIAIGMLEVDYNYEDVKITGMVGKPEIARANRTNQMFFVNGRYVKDKTLSASIEQAFKGMLPIGKYAVCILNIVIPPEKVDVNVHPAKLEVRFEEEQKIFKAVYHSVKEGLLSGELIASTERIERLAKKQNGEIPGEQQELDEIKPTDIKIDVPNLDYNKDVDTIGNKLTGIFNKLKQHAEEKENETAYKPESSNFIADIYKTKSGITEEPTQEKIEEETNFVPTQTEPEAVVEQNLETTQEIIVEKQATPESTIDEESFKKEVEKYKEDMVTPTEEQVEEMTNMIVNKEEQSASTENAQVEETEEFSKSFEEMYTKLFGKVPIKNKIEEEEIKYTNMKLADGNEAAVFDKASIKPDSYKFIGIAFSTYIIIQIKDDIYILDQHAAHERIMYEKVKSNFYSSRNKDSQTMLIPDVITLTHKEMTIVQENTALFEKSGFIFEEFGENTIKLTGVPNSCIELNTKELFLNILDEIGQVAITANQEKEDKFIATIACKAAVKANMALDEKEVNSLMENLLVLPNPFTCPHGRPTAIKMSKTDIEKKFSRK